MRVTGWRAALVGAVAGMLAGCSSSGTTPALPSPSSGSASGAGVRLTVTPSTALYDTPFLSTVSGLQPAELVTLRLSTTDQHGRLWSSQAQFRAAADGSFDTRQAPVSGSYQTADPMGLMQTLTSGTPAAFLGPTTLTLTETVASGETTLAAATLTRLRPTQTGVTSKDVRPSADGLYGELFEPATVPTSAPGVVVIGGSGGGLETGAQAALLAAHGYPALALAYFAAPGLPGTLQRIPLEYFDRAAQWLAGQPGVDRRRIVLWGVSRGSEAALLTAAHFRSDVRAVVAAAPSAEANPTVGGTAPAWTYHTIDVPTAPATEFYAQSATSDATIRVEDIAGPVLLVCGGQDEVWRSCPNSQVIAARLTGHRRAAPTTLSYPSAGHGVGSLTPYLPDTLLTSSLPDGTTYPLGGSFQADQAGRADAWPKVLAFLHALTA